ncbi:hypothetical protein QBC37DRAFT_449440 [Rhypophila decipiens]|uniref:Uncharacterized protein n=1 Tax=Rhypophila decipiens TaxID=261697 RepID=A0AAN6Y4A0_9PEZI|nr:hypothetical protein QBC37DRAFT_449440 [Rhypophila decipiens]
MSDNIDPACLAGFNATWGDIFERTYCYNKITDFLENSNVTSSPACMGRLFIDGTKANLKNPLLTLKGCQAFCGVDWGYYPDSASRVVDWVVPIVVLVSNINLSPVERRIMMGIIHALGDPIDVTWSLLDKLYEWHICHQVARRAVEAARLASGPRLHAQDPDRRSANTILSVETANKADKNDHGAVQIQVTAVNSRDSTNAPDTRNASLDIPAPGPSERIRIIATVLGGFEELAGYQMTSPRQFYERTIRMLGNPASEFSPSAPSNASSSSQAATRSPNEAIDQWLDTALCLVDDRTNEFLRTGMAVGLYLFQLSSEFIDQITQNNENTPGGRIGAALMLSWLIPVALLSNLLGGFPSQRSNLRPLLDLLDKTLPPQYLRDGGHVDPASPLDHEGWALRDLNPHRQDQDDEELEAGAHLNFHTSSWSAFFTSQRSTGSIYGFRPHKTRTLYYSTGRDKLIRLSLPILATIPVIASFIASFILHWEAVPMGFSCRHVWVITVFGLWVISPFLTYFFVKLDSPSRKDKLGYRWGWWLIYTKDMIFGLGALSMIIASVIGMFNSCFCWSLAMWVGEAKAIMMVNTRGQYLEYKKGRYPGMVGGFILLQVGFVASVAGLMWNGLGVMRWGEGNKRGAWDRLGKGEVKVLGAFLRGVTSLGARG